MKKEIAFVSALIKNYPRTAQQTNQPFHSDAEVVKLPNGSFMGVSVDAISEEIELGLLRDPISLGWLTVTASISDLAAIGMKCDRLSVFYKQKTVEPEWTKSFFQGVSEAAAANGITQIEEVRSTGSEMISACTAYAFSPEAPKLSRVGLKTGDTLFLTGPIGWGNAVAFANLAVRAQAPAIADSVDKTFRPVARSREGLFIQNFSNVCIDTSDGLLSTLKWLEIFNEKKLVIDYRPALFHPIALDIAQKIKVNPWLFIAAQVGEFELLFSVPAEKLAEFKEKAKNKNYHFIEIGEVTSGKGICLRTKKTEKDLEIEALLDMLHDGVEPARYIQAMLQFGVDNEIKFED